MWFISIVWSPGNTSYDPSFFSIIKNSKGSDIRNTPNMPEAFCSDEVRYYILNKPH